MRVERAYEQDYNVSRHIGPSKVRFAPQVRLDLSQIRDIRGKTPRKGSISTYMQSVMKGTVATMKAGPPSTEQFRARERVLRPYRRLHIGSMRVRGGK